MMPSYPSGPCGEVMRHALGLYTVADRAEAIYQQLLFEGRAREVIRQRLNKLGMGIAGDTHPVTVGILRSVIGSLAVLYRAPPTRYLLDGEIRLGDGDAEQRIAWRLYRASHVDSFMRHVDAMRSLLRFVVVRIYASDAAKRVKLACYPPTAVYRDPDPGEPDDLRADRRIVLERADGFELFERLDSGSWRLTLYSRSGVQQGEAETLDVLPVVPFWDGWPDRPYLQPFGWRTEYTFALASTVNEVGAAVMWDVHSRLVIEEDAPGPGVEPPPEVEPPTEVGPGTLSVLAPGQTMKAIPLQPQVAAISAACAEILKHWYRAEGITPEDVRSSQASSALALKVLSEGLAERRESLAPLAAESERLLFEAFKSIHNQRAEAWGQPWIAEGRGFAVDLAPIDSPRDPKEALDVLSRELALGLTSLPQATQDYFGLPRQEAVDRLAQVAIDRTEYAEAHEVARSTISGAQPGSADPSQVPTDGASGVQLASRAQRSSGGPYKGPRGGLYADPGLTIPWNG